jgi:hypothetical protein
VPPREDHDPPSQVCTSLIRFTLKYVLVFQVRSAYSMGRGLMLTTHHCCCYNSSLASAPLTTFHSATEPSLDAETSVQLSKPNLTELMVSECAITCTEPTHRDQRLEANAAPLCL